MSDYLKVKLDFDHDSVDKTIKDCIDNKQSGYVCVVDMTNLAIAYSNEEHLTILNNSLVNISDSSWIPLILNLKYHTHFSNYCGPDLFSKYIKEKDFNYLFLGTNTDLLESLKKNFVDKYKPINLYTYQELPYCKVEDFNYAEIGNMINSRNPDIIFVSLGAPKQEQFMARLLPYVKKGVMIGIGAAFDFYSGNKNTKRAPLWIQKMKMEWIYRIFLQPKKQLKRVSFIFKCLPKIFFSKNN